MSIRSSWRNYQLKKARGNRREAGVFKGFDTMDKVLIFCAFAQREDTALQRFVEELTKAGKTVNTLMYFPRKRKELPPELSEHSGILCKSDLNWYGRPKETFVNHHLNTHYDLVLDTFAKAEEGPAFVRALLQTDFSFGRVASPQLEHNILINITEENNLVSFFKEVHYYLHFINNPS